MAARGRPRGLRARAAAVAAADAADAADASQYRLHKQYTNIEVYINSLIK